MHSSRSARLMRTLLIWAATIGCGVAVWAGFPPLNAWWAIPLGLGGLLCALQGRGAWSAGWRAFLFGLGFFTPLLHFTAVSMGNVLGWAALTITESLYMAVMGASWSFISRLTTCGRLQRHPGLARVFHVVAFALLWSGCEEIRSSWPWGGFPFGRLAFAMADAPILPLAAYGGSLGLTFVVALAGACCAVVVMDLRRVRLFPAIVAAAVAGAVLIAPTALPLHFETEDGTIRVAAVQGSVPGHSRDGAGADDAFGRALEVTGNHAQATLSMSQQVSAGTLDVVVWPENAADLDPRTHPEAAELVQQAAQAVQAPILVGAVAYEEKVRYNDIVIWEADSGAGAYYRKHRPVPFGEYIPLRAQLRRLTSQVDRISTDMAAGQGPNTLTFTAPSAGRDVTAAMGICFEVAYDDVLRAGVKQGGELIIIPTNNASFGTSAEAAQQLEQGRIQAVIHGRSVVQVSTVGITAIITPQGAIKRQLQTYTPGALVEDVGLRTSITVADTLGPWPAYVVMGVTALLTAAGMVVTVMRWIASLLAAYRN